MNTTDRFGYLLHLYLNNGLSATEHEEFFALLASGQYDNRLADALQQDLQSPDFQQTDLPPHLAQEVIRQIYGAEKSAAKVLPITPRKNKRWVWMAAASLLVVCLLSYFYLTTEKPAPISAQIPKLMDVPAGMAFKQNKGTSPITLALHDGSTVQLQPGSAVHYPTHFTNATREIYLEGEAFFTVTKNAAKPFLVYANNVVTKVLGTSFTVRTAARTGNVEVLVKSGRVQVYENERLGAAGKPGSVVVTPNQKAVYASAQRLLQTALVEKPEPLTAESEKEKTTVRFVYEHEPLKNVLAGLEKAYGIEIVTENSNIARCVFTGDVSGQDLFTQLKIICLATNATYEINQTRILIKGPGCP